MWFKCVDAHSLVVYTFMAYCGCFGVRILKADKDNFICVFTTADALASEGILYSVSCVLGEGKVIQYFITV